MCIRDRHEPTEEERIAAEKEAERLRRKRESNRKYIDVYKRQV